MSACLHSVRECVCLHTHTQVYTFLLSEDSCNKVAFVTILLKDVLQGGHFDCVVVHFRGVNPGLHTSVHSQEKI